MLQGLVNSSAIPVLEQVVGFTQARHNVLAGNIANLDTPGYRTRDLSPENFQARLRSAVQSQDAGNTPLTGSEDPFAAVAQERNSILYHDDTNVGLEQQLAEIGKNQALHSQAAAIMTSQMRLLRDTIREQP